MSSFACTGWDWWMWVHPGYNPHWDNIQGATSKPVYALKCVLVFKLVQIILQQRALESKVLVEWEIWRQWELVKMLVVLKEWNWLADVAERMHIVLLTVQIHGEYDSNSFRIVRKVFSLGNWSRYVLPFKSCDNRAQLKLNLDIGPKLRSLQMPLGLMSK